MVLADVDDEVHTHTHTHTLTRANAERNGAIKNNLLIIKLWFFGSPVVPGILNI